MPRAGRVTITLMIAAVAMIAMSAGTVCGQPDPYHPLNNWAHLPDGRKWGWTVGISVDRSDNVWVFERCGANTCDGSTLAPILELDPSGNVLKSLGAGLFVSPHGLSLDKDGNVWVTDYGKGKGKGEQVFEFSPDGKVLLTLGKAGVAGDGPDTFNQPSAVVVAPNGDIFVADGHGGNSNARIVKFSKDGRFIKAWGKKGSAPGEFDNPHAIAIDSKGRLFVGDTNNNRIQIFNQDGKFLTEWKQFGRPSGIFIDPRDNIYVADFQSDEKRNPGFKPGIRVGSAKDGSVKYFIPALGPETKPTSITEGVAVDSKGNLYGAESNTMNVRKYVKE